MNIFIRSQDNDLFKYLSDEQVAAMEINCTEYCISPGELIYNAAEVPDSIILLKSGTLELRRPDSGNLAFVYPGEIDCEYGYFDPSPLGYDLIAVKPVIIHKFSYSTLKYVIQHDPDLGARIHAAMNDTLCLKIVRLTHRRSLG